MPGHPRASRSAFLFGDRPDDGTYATNSTCRLTLRTSVQKEPPPCGAGAFGEQRRENLDRLPLDTILVQRCGFYRKENLQINKELVKPPHRWNSPALFTLAGIAIQLCQALLAFQLFLPPVGQVLPGLRHPLKHLPLVFRARSGKHGPALFSVSSVIFDFSHRIPNPAKTSWDCFRSHNRSYSRGCRAKTTYWMKQRGLHSEPHTQLRGFPPFP